MRTLVAVCAFAGAGALAGQCAAVMTKSIERIAFVRMVCSFEFAAAALRFGPTADAAFACMLLMLFTAAALCDTATMQIPNAIPLAAILLYFVRAAFFRSARLSVLPGVVGALTVGASMMLTAIAARAVYGTDALGGGDIKLFAVCGLWFGARGGFAVVVMSCVFGLLYCRVKKIQGGVAFPFAPSIAAAVFTAAAAGGGL